MTLLTLGNTEYKRLLEIASTTHDARLLRRAQALLWLNDGEAVEEIAEQLLVTRQTVYRWVKRFQQRHDLDLESRLGEGARGGRPRTVRGLIEPLIAQALEKDPRALGYHATVWTAPLLCRYLEAHHQVVASRRSVSAALVRLDIAWKRPRHDLGRRSPTWRQAKGGSNAGSPGALAQ
jgi:transposase